MYAFVIVAAVLALWFAIAALKAPHAGKVLAAGLWGAYAVWEYFIANGTLCEAGCNIRVDLVVVLPLLAIAAYLGFQKQPRTGAVVILLVVCLALVAAVLAAMGHTPAAIATGLAGVAAAIAGVLSARRRPT